VDVEAADGERPSARADSSAADSVASYGAKLGSTKS
jgi:hypothetical protein